LIIPKNRYKKNLMSLFKKNITNKMIDISLPLHEGMITWPDSTSFRLLPVKSFSAGDEVNVSRLDCDVHMGTHIDAPRHYLKEGVTVDMIPTDILIGPAQVCHLPNAKSISSKELSDLALPHNVERLLLRTCNSILWSKGVSTFKKDYVALTADGARWVVDHNVRLIGIDYLSVQCYDDDPLTHKILMEAGVVILEGLNLADVSPGNYELICLPLYLVGAEGAPARAVLRVSNV
jgi:arylformamidase